MANGQLPPNFNIAINRQLEGHAEAYQQALWSVRQAALALAKVPE